MTSVQRALARHALGLPNKQRTPYRNHFVAGPGHSDYGYWLDLVENGDAKRKQGSEISGGDDIFWLTKQGALKALDGREKLDPEDFQ